MTRHSLQRGTVQAGFGPQSQGIGPCPMTCFLGRLLFGDSNAKSNLVCCLGQLILSNRLVILGISFIRQVLEESSNSTGCWEPVKPLLKNSNFILPCDESFLFFPSRNYGLRRRGRQSISRQPCKLDTAVYSTRRAGCDRPS